MKKKIPTFKTDEEAERFVDTADLSKYDLSGLKPVRHARQNWAEASKKIAAEGDDTPVWPEFANEGDENLVW